MSHLVIVTGEDGGCGANVRSVGAKSGGGGRDLGWVLVVRG